MGRKKKKKYYAVQYGREVGVFTSWDNAKASVHRFKGARFKSFSTREKAEAFLAERGQRPTPSVTTTTTTTTTSSSSRRPSAGPVVGMDISSTPQRVQNADDAAVSAVFMELEREVIEVASKSWSWSCTLSGSGDDTEDSDCEVVGEVDPSLQPSSSSSASSSSSSSSSPSSLSSSSSCAAPSGVPYSRVRGVVRAYLDNHDYEPI